MSQYLKKCIIYQKRMGFMDKRKEANLRVKKNITEALFALMDKKDF